MAITSGWSNVRHAFANRNYRTYQIGRFLSQITNWMYKVAIGWMVWKLTHSAAWLGVFGLLDQVAAVFVLPVAGALADRLNSLKVMRVTQAILLVFTVVLSLLDAFDMLTLGILVVFTLFHGLVTAAQQPAGQAILPNLLSRHELTTAYGVNSMTFNVARFVGPMIAGVMINEWGTAPVIFSNAIGALLFSWCLMRMQMNFTPPIRPATSSLNMMRDIREGFHYARRHPGIGPTMGIMSALSLFPFTIDLLLPSLADGVYQAGAPGLAWMTSMMGVGALMQAAVIARRGGITGLSAYFYHGIWALGAAFLALAVSPSLWLALIWIFCIGFASSATRVSSMTLLQYSVDAHMRGRVASFYSLINQTGPALASLFVGVLGDIIGVPLTMGLMGVWTLVIWIVALRYRQAMKDSLEVDPVPTAERRKKDAAPPKP